MSVKPQRHRKPKPTSAPSRHQDDTSPTPPPNSTKVCHSFFTFVRMLQGLVEGLISVSMSLTLLSSRLDFFFVIRCPPSKSLTQMNITGHSNFANLDYPTVTSFRFLQYFLVCMLNIITFILLSPGYPIRLG